MGSYVVSTPEERREMLRAIGLERPEELYSDVPANLMVESLDMPSGRSELEVRRRMTGIAAKNRIFPTIFRGVGAYRHYIPALVKQIASKEEFVTTYTPYQAEVSQGILQSIFEFQTMICELTGMDAANASIYDGATAAAEAAAMCVDRKRNKVLLSASSDPMTIETVGTYCMGSGAELVLVPEKDGVTDRAALEQLLDDSSACFYLQYPNYCGLLEEAGELGELAHAKGAKFIMGVNPMAAAILPSAGEWGADIAVGEAQPLGLPMAFGGPYLGFMAATSALARKLPGRIVGETVDRDGERGFVLTLQAREQHIRREKASSNVCSNQALCALTASVYLAVMGPEGLRQAAEQSHAKAQYLAEQLTRIPGVALVHGAPFFHEFVTTCPTDSAELLGRLAEKGILGGFPVEGGLLWCATEMNTKEEIDSVAALVKEVAGA